MCLKLTFELISAIPMDVFLKSYREKKKFRRDIRKLCICKCLVDFWKQVPDAWFVKKCICKHRHDGDVQPSQLSVRGHFCVPEKQSFKYLMWSSVRLCILIVMCHWQDWKENKNIYFWTCVTYVHLINNFSSMLGCIT